MLRAKTFVSKKKLRETQTNDQRSMAAFKEQESETNRMPQKGEQKHKGVKRDSRDVKGLKGTAET